MSYRSLRSVSASAITVVLTGALAGCATEQDSSSVQVSPPSSSATVSDQSFTGPWASDFAYWSSSFPTDFSTRVFADSKITEQEVLEGRALIEACYAERGYSVSFDEYGRAAVDMKEGDGNEAPSVMGECGLVDGGVMNLYFMIKGNPEKRDEMAIRAECLVREGIVEQGYTAQDLQQAYDSELFPWSPGDPAATRCLNDPLGTSGG